MRACPGDQLPHCDYSFRAFAGERKRPVVWFMPESLGRAVFGVKRRFAGLAKSWVAAAKKGGEGGGKAGLSKGKVMITNRNKSELLTIIIEPILVSVLFSLIDAAYSYMMRLSRTTGYAIQAMGCMNDRSCVTHQIAAIAKCAGVPRPYLAKIIGALTRKGLVMAKRGFHGGISLARPARDISILEIVEAVEGDHWLGECLLGFDECARHKCCPTQAFWQGMRREIIKELGQLRLADVLDAKAVNAGAVLPKPALPLGQPPALPLPVPAPRPQWLPRTVCQV
jgi:Rrf2 family transcriptional regulator, iron-sulfur cluster assembly transcription factor